MRHYHIEGLNTTAINAISVIRANLPKAFFDALLKVNYLHGGSFSSQNCNAVWQVQTQ